MFSVSAANDGKELIIKFKGYFDSQQAEQFYDQAQKTVPKLKKGFSVLTDLSSLEQMDMSAQLFIAKTMDLLRVNGVSKVIRIIPDREKDIGLNIMSAFHYPGEIPIVTCKSCQEAEEVLNKLNGK